MKYKLKNVAAGLEYALDHPSVLMGRSASCQIIISDGHPSREHARIQQKKEGIYIQDLHSTNGTYVNNRRIEEDTRLMPGDVVTIGLDSFVLMSGDELDMTIVAGRLAPKAINKASILISEDADDGESTQILEPFPLPQGWADGQGDVFDRDTLFRSRKAQNQLIFKASTEHKLVFSAALIFLFSSGEPGLLGLSTDRGKSRWSLGRGKQCDLIVDDPCISDCHAFINYQNGNWWVEDNHSTNGIRANNHLHKKLELSDSLILLFGRLESIFRIVHNVKNNGT